MGEKIRGGAAVVVVDGVKRVRESSKRPRFGMFADLFVFGQEIDNKVRHFLLLI
jgi:hypothetical protein